nr:Fe3+ hydroxamate ABC transporter substrate-binding protein [Bacillus alveayuensis]
MFRIKPTCSICSKPIEGNELIYVQMRYPEKRGMTEIKAFIQNEGKIICSHCFENHDRK